MVTPRELIKIALDHMGEDAPTGTCVAKGAFPWSREAGLPIENKSYSASAIAQLLGAHFGGPKNVANHVTAFEAYARERNRGWGVIPSRDAVPGDYLIWPNRDHISLYVERRPNGSYRSVGAGGPTGKIFQQPKDGGGNPPAFFVCAVRPPFGTSGLAGMGAVPLDDPDGKKAKDRVRRIARFLNARALGIHTTAEKDGIPGVNYWTLVQTAGRKDGLYPVPFLIDGDPGPKTFEVERHYGRIA